MTAPAAHNGRIANIKMVLGWRVSRGKGQLVQAFDQRPIRCDDALSVGVAVGDAFTAVHVMAGANAIDNLPESKLGLVADHEVARRLAGRHGLSVYTPRTLADLGALERDLADIRARVPGCSVATDVIVGFPGETERDFEDTMRLIAELDFDQSFSFIFSPRPGTPAAGLPDDLPDWLSAVEAAALICTVSAVSRLITSPPRPGKSTASRCWRRSSMAPT
mgnify:CR=1 FL=1